MKIKFGLISNSSTSSFLVKYRDFNWAGNGTKKGAFNFYLTKEQLRKLKKIGFQYTTYGLDSTKEVLTTQIKDLYQHQLINLFYYVICNQDDVIYFLLKHKIPFIASCHYDQEFVCYDGISDFFYEILNPQYIINCMLGAKSKMTKKDLTFTPKEINVKEWLKKEEKFVENLV